MVADDASTDHTATVAANLGAKVVRVEKRQIAAMVGFLLPRASFDSTDEADALAIAITHAHHRQSTALRLKVVGI